MPPVLSPVTYLTPSVALPSSPWMSVVIFVFYENLSVCSVHGKNYSPLIKGENKNVGGLTIRSLFMSDYWLK